METNKRQLMLGWIIMLVALAGVVYAVVSIGSAFLPSDLSVAVALDFPDGEPDAELAAEPAARPGVRPGAGSGTEPIAGPGADADGRAFRGGLVVHGHVAQDGVPASRGKVHVRVRRQSTPVLDLSYHAMIAADGTFTTAGTTGVTDVAPGLAVLSHRDRLIVTAEAVVPLDDNGVARGSATAIWGTTGWFTWSLRLGFLAIVLLMLVFLRVFIGDITLKRQRAAVAALYALAFIFLVVPFMAPVWIVRHPHSVEAMPSLPVSVLKVRKIDDNVMLNQWAINIGGVATAADVPLPPLDPGDVRTVADVPMYDVSSGLVIPLYVLIVAALGGAISMTRRLPEVQSGIAIRFETWKKSSVGRSNIALGVADTLSIFAQAKDELTGRSHAGDDDDDAPGAGEDWIRQFEKHSQELADDRQKLVALFMYLITAPFLGILTYYLLFMIEEQLARRVPVVVLVTFASGLMAEDILTRIKDVARGIIGRPAAERRMADDGAEVEVIEVVTPAGEAAAGAPPARRKKASRTKKATSTKKTRAPDDR